MPSQGFVAASCSNVSSLPEFAARRRIHLLHFLGLGFPVSGSSFWEWGGGGAGVAGHGPSGALVGEGGTREGNGPLEGGPWLLLSLNC